MRVVDADSLTRHNLMYREPALYDELLADESTTADLRALIEQHRPGTRTVLDLGCGTGRLLAELHGHGVPAGLREIGISGVALPARARFVPGGLVDR